MAVNRSAVSVSLHGATIEVAESWNDVTNYNFLLPDNEIPKVTVSRLGPIPADQRDSRFEAIRSTFIRGAEPYAVSACTRRPATLEVREFSMQLANIPDDDEDDELDAEDARPVNWLQVAWISTAREALQLLAHCTVEQPTVWPNILTRSAVALPSTYGRNHSQDHYQVGGVLLYFPSGVVAPRVFRYEAPEGLERLEAVWASTREPLVLPDGAVVFGEQPANGSFVREIPGDPNLRCAHRAAWYYASNEDSTPAFAGKSLQSFARGTLQLTYFARATPDALPVWQRIVGSAQEERSP